MATKIEPNIVYPLNGGYVGDLAPTLRGTGEPGASVTGQLDGKPFSAAVSDNGVWSYRAEQQLQDLTEHSLSLSQTDQIGQTSPAKTVSFRTDTQLLLHHTLKYPQNNQIIKTNSPIISGTGKAGATIEAELGGKIYNTVVDRNGSWQIQANAVPEGSSFLYVIQKDMGNMSPALCAGFMVDTIAPSGPTVEFPADQSFINNPIPTFCGEGEPNASISAVVDEKKYFAQVNQQGKWNFEISEGLMDDTHILSTRQIDLAGNISPEIISIFTIKTVQPSPPVIVSPISGSITADTSPEISGMGEKGCVILTRIYDKVYSTEVGRDGTWQMTISDKLADGTHTLKVYQADKAGNISSDAELTLRVDTSVPAAPVIIYPEKGGYVSSKNFMVRGTGEPDSKVICTVAGKEYTAPVAPDGSWAVDVTNNENIKYKMDYTISAKQVDLAGNESTAVKTVFDVDPERLKAPEIAFPTNGTSINTPNPLITGTGKAGAKVELSLNGKKYTAAVQSNGTWAAQITEDLSKGANTLILSQTDCGNVSQSESASFNVKLSNPPCPTIDTPTDKQPVASADVIISGRGEAGAQVNIKLDDACYHTQVGADCSWEYTVLGLLQGIHAMLVSQKDQSGNESACASVCFATMPAQPNLNRKSYPTAYTISYNPPGPELASKTIATLRTSNPVTYNKVLGNEFSMIIPANGTYDFNYIEENGTSGSVTAGVTWIDNEAPIIVIEPSGKYYSSDKTVSFYKFGGSSIKAALLNGTPFKTGTKVSAEGKYQIEITDKAGNIAAGCFVIDRSSPTVTGAENNMVYNTDVTLNWSDDISGIKSSVLNGLNILPGTVLTENGAYTLTVTDFADNITERSFSIQK
ncbi:MAG: hypothetical protein CVU91_11165 [Firmicutes bacterium HGW-Firmicutes-16]|nr:MAG: hypothetical protein CVU91_11165 [Firmicutes bacterium HGW-Firmicutes-16]